MMVKVLIYAYATGTFYSHAVARKLEEDVAFRMLAAGNFPQHRTVCEFRRRHLAEFSELFVGVVQVAREMGLARFGKLSVDGTKVRANASKRKAMSYERMNKEAARLQAEIEALLTKAGMVDAEGDERWGEDFRGDELPEELQRREKRLAAIQAAKARLEAAQRGRDDERGREPGQDRNPPGRAALQAGLRRARAEGAEQFHRSREPDHEDQQRGGSSSATTRRRRQRRDLDNILAKEPQPRTAMAATSSRLRPHPETRPASRSRLDQPTRHFHNRRNESVNRNRRCLKVVDKFRCESSW